jgi:hypothetical protein
VLFRSIETGASVVVRRRLDDLREVACWPTGGIDAHELLLDTFDGRATLLVANGGVPTRPETGRARVDLASMSSSLVRLDAATGASMGRWRLDDPRLSLRHMARAANGHVGIALQAEHDDPAQRAAAPVLAVFDGRRLHTQAPPALHGLAGYGGSIAAVPGGYLVSCTRAGLVSRFDDQGRWLDAVALDEACALLADGPRWWAGGAPQALGPDGRVDTAQHRLDNHWIDGRRHA